jgi:hypothetical protein
LFDECVASNIPKDEGTRTNQFGGTFMLDVSFHTKTTEQYGLDTRNRLVTVCPKEKVLQIIMLKVSTYVFVLSSAKIHNNCNYKTK